MKLTGLVAALMLAAALAYGDVRDLNVLYASNWRGPLQSGVSLEKNLPDKITLKDALWQANFPGQSTPVIANGKLYIMGYLGDGPDLQEGVACFQAETGKKLWDQRYSDFLSDTIYLRYATSARTWAGK